MGSIKRRRVLEFFTKRKYNAFSARFVYTVYGSWPILGCDGYSANGTSQIILFSCASYAHARRIEKNRFFFDCFQIIAIPIGK